MSDGEEASDPHRLVLLGYTPDDAPDGGQMDLFRLSQYIAEETDIEIHLNVSTSDFEKFERLREHINDEFPVPPGLPWSDDDEAD